MTPFYNPLFSLQPLSIEDVLNYGVSPTAVAFTGLLHVDNDPFKTISDLLADQDYGSPAACGVSPSDPRIYLGLHISEAASGRSQSDESFGDANNCPCPIQWCHWINGPVDGSSAAPSHCTNGSQGSGDRACVDLARTNVLASTPHYIPTTQTTSASPLYPPSVDLAPQRRPDSRTTASTTPHWHVHFGSSSQPSSALPSPVDHFIYHDHPSYPHSDSTPPFAAMVMTDNGVGPFGLQGQVAHQVADISQCRIDGAIRQNKRKRNHDGDFPTSGHLEPHDMENETRSRRRRVSHGTGATGYPAQSSRMGSSAPMSWVGDRRLMAGGQNHLWCIDAPPDDHIPDCLSVTTSTGGPSGPSLADAKQLIINEGIMEHSSTTLSSREKKSINDSNRIAAERGCYEGIRASLQSLLSYDVSQHEQCDLLEEAIVLINHSVFPERARILKDENSRRCTVKRRVEKQRRALKKGYAEILREMVSPPRSSGNWTPKFTRLEVLQMVQARVSKICRTRRAQPPSVQDSQ